jgi:KaiC/GvpD/RAD55 family RecA-like ATPase
VPTDPIFNIPEIDEPLSVYLPDGWVALVTGGAGTHLLAKQFARHGIGRVPVLYYTTHERVADVERAFGDFGWDASGIQVRNLAGEYFDQVLSRELAIARVRERGLTLAELTVPVTTSPVAAQSFDLTHRIIGDLAALDGRFRLVVDSVDFLLDVLPAAEVVNLARQIRYRAQTLGGTACLVLRPEVHDPGTGGALEDLADLVLRMTAEPKPDGVDLALIIEKVRNHPERSRLCKLTVGRDGFAARSPDGGASATKGNSS